jgi:hypothetical protein
MPEESTTPELVELVQRVVDAVNARAFDGVQSAYTRQRFAFAVIAQTGHPADSTGWVQQRYAAVATWAMGWSSGRETSSTWTRPALPPNASLRSRGRGCRTRMWSGRT